MKQFGLAVVLAAALGAGTTLTITAQAAPAGLSGQLGAAADSLNMLEQTQYIYGGRRYCWYFDGWRDPKRPIREADIDRPLYDLCLHSGEWMAEVSVDEMVDAIQPNKADHD
jgi:hypothetical protein